MMLGGVSAISQFTVTKKDLDQVCKATKTAMQDLVVSGRSTHEEPSSTTSPHKKKLAASNNDNLVGEEKKRDHIGKLKGTDSVQVDAQKYIQSLVLAADKMDPKSLAKETEKLKDWLKQNGVEVNYSDLKSGDEVGKLKRVLQAMKENAHVMDSADSFVTTKKDVEQVSKLNNIPIEKLVVLAEEGKKYGSSDEVPVDLNKFIDSLLFSENVDKKTLAKHGDQIKDYP